MISLFASWLAPAFRGLHGLLAALQLAEAGLPIPPPHRLVEPSIGQSSGRSDEDETYLALLTGPVPY